MGVRGAKAWFCLRESFYKSIHEICFELTKQISVSGRALPSAARALSGHAFFICRKAARRGARAPRGCAAQGRGLAFASGPAFAKGCVHICIAARGSVRARLPVPPPSPGESRPLPPRAGGTPPRERGRREDCTPRVSSSFLPARDTPSSAPCTRARPCIWGRAAGWACRRTTPRPGARCAARRSRTGGG